MQNTKFVTSIAALRALSTPDQLCGAPFVITENYYDDANGGGHQYTWNAANTDADNGGTVIKLNANTTNAPGRYLAADYGGKSLNCAQFGASPAKTGSVNRTAIQAAHDALPQTYTNQHLTPSGREPRQGFLYIPAGLYNLDGKLYFSAGGVIVKGDGRFLTRLILETTSVYTDHTLYADTNLLNYVVTFELSTDAAQNNHFGSALIGVEIGCNNNPGASGLFLSGAQGTYMDDVLVSNFGVEGIRFVGQSFGSIWVAGNYTAVGSGLILGNPGQPNQVFGASASVEHVALDANIPFVLLQGNGLTLGILQGETSGGYPCKFLKIYPAINVQIGHVAGNGFCNTAANPATLIQITGDSGNVHIGSYQVYGADSYGTVIVDDDASTGGDNRPGGFHRVITTARYNSKGTYDTDGDFSQITVGQVNGNLYASGSLYGSGEINPTSGAYPHTSLSLGGNFVNSETEPTNVMQMCVGNHDGARQYVSLINSPTRGLIESHAYVNVSGGVVGLFEVGMDGMNITGTHGALSVYGGQAPSTVISPPYGFKLFSNASDGGKPYIKMADGTVHAVTLGA